MVKWTAALTEIREDNRSSSTEIYARALDLLIQTIGDSEPSGTANEYREWFLRLSRDLIRAQPAMAALFRLVNDMLWACDEPALAKDVRQRALDYLQERQARAPQVLRAVAAAGAAELAKYDHIMTYSRSATVLDALQLMAKKGRTSRIYCSESRPMLEGQTLAHELSSAGLEVVIGIDMALFGWLDDVEALVIGADCLSISGVVNKIGSAALARAAIEREIPSIVLCSSYKFLPREYMLSKTIQTRDPEEIMPPAGAQLDVRNVYFDIAPLDSFSMVITESGYFDACAIRDELAAVKIYPGLQGRLTQRWA
jgi:translation initiation factor 2B subunit (eIF-2B alpha/beta/delta family)